MKSDKVIDCKLNISEFENDRNSAFSGKSGYDFCFNYFQNYRKENRLNELCDDNNIQTSCAHLGQYLANWGMYRGKAFIKSSSMLIYKTLIEEITKTKWGQLWIIDVNTYDKSAIDLILSFGNRIEEILKSDDSNKASDTLKTKIMLGLFGNVPAFDQNFCKTFGIYRLNETSLIAIKKFYDDNRDIIDETKIYTFDFISQQKTNLQYTRAKLIDMIGFIGGNKKS